MRLLCTEQGALEVKNYYVFVAIETILFQGVFTIFFNVLYSIKNLETLLLSCGLLMTFIIKEVLTFQQEVDEDKDVTRIQSTDPDCF